jgi:hypothetical protein
MDDRLDSAIRHSGKKHQAFDASQGRHFAEFSRKQPECLQNSLLQIDALLKESEPPTKTGDAALLPLRTELSKLRPLYEEIKQKRKLNDSIREKCEKSTRAATRADEKVAQMRVKNPSSPELTKLQNGLNCPPPKANGRHLL